MTKTTETTEITTTAAGLPAPTAEQMAADAQALLARLGNMGGDVIHVTQDKKFKLPDGNIVAGPLEVVVVDFVYANSLYEGRYDPKNPSAPVCAAVSMEANSLVPFAVSPNKQAEDCASCPMNQFGSNGEGKACKNSVWLAVLPVDADDSTPLAVIKTSPTAIKFFDRYAATVARLFGTAPYGVITEVGFDPNSTFATLRFGNPRPNPNVAQAMSRRSEAAARLTQQPDFT